MKYRFVSPNKVYSQRSIELIETSFIYAKDDNNTLYSTFSMNNQNMHRYHKFHNHSMNASVRTFLSSVKQKEYTYVFVNIIFRVYKFFSRIIIDLQKSFIDKSKKCYYTIIINMYYNIVNTHAVHCPLFLNSLSQ